MNAHLAMEALAAGQTASPENSCRTGPYCRRRSRRSGTAHLKAFRLIQNADVVFHDRLVSDEIMDLVRRDADRVSVGKAKANHSCRKLKSMS